MASEADGVSKRGLDSVEGSATPRVVQQRTSEWYELRRGTVSASQLSRPLGMFERRDRQTGEFDATERHAYFLRLRNRELDPPLDAESAIKANWGTVHEDRVLETYRQLRGDSELPLDVGSQPHSVHPWLRASPDGVVGDDGLVEIKCPYKLKDDMPHTTDWVENGPWSNFWIPNHYLAQMNVQMEVMDRPWCDHAVATSNGIRIERVPRDKELFEGIMEYIHAFYTAAKTEDAPMPTITRDDRARIRALFDAHIVRVIDYSADARSNNSYLGTHSLPDLLPPLF